MPAKTGIWKWQEALSEYVQMPAFAGMTAFL